MAETQAPPKRPAVGAPFKGSADQSWPICPNCLGAGAITQERAIQIAASPTEGVGQKGDDCVKCNGAGRVPDASWPACGCAGNPDCIVCFGLGQLSPNRQAEIPTVLAALEEQLKPLTAHRDQYAQAQSALEHAGDTPGKKK